VLTKEFEFRLVVVEAGGRLILGPAVGAMASLASALELDVLKCTFVRVRVAVLASSSREPLESRHLFTGLWAVTFLARNCLVLSSQRVRSFGVTKSNGGLPGILRVAA